MLTSCNARHQKYPILIINGAYLHGNQGLIIDEARMYGVEFGLLLRGAILIDRYTIGRLELPAQ
jgi:hypothetical protein